MARPPLIETLNPDIAALPDFSMHWSDEEIKQRYGVQQVYRMYMNESAYGPSPRVVEALREEAARVGSYPVMRDDALRDGLAETLGHGLTRENFFTGCSGYEALELVMRAFLRPGDEVIVMHPTFSVYDRLVLLQGAVLRNVPLRPDTFAVDIDAVLAAVTDNTRIVLVCNPNNPTGTLLPKAQMDKLVAGMPEHVLIVTDEVYWHFVTDPQFPDSLEYVVNGRNVVVIHTFSKGYGMAGMRMGYGITLPILAKYIHKFYRGFHLNRLQITAGLVALQDPDHLRKNIDAVVRGRDFICGELDRLDVRYWPTQTNFIMLDCTRPSADVRQQFLERGVIVSTLLGTLLRITVSYEEANKAFVQGLEEILLGNAVG